MLYKKTEKLSIIKREGEIMGMFVNPNAAAFQCAVNSEVYIDKTGLLEYTNKIERYSIDECFLDMTNCIPKGFTLLDIGNQINERVKQELGFTVNVGVAHNKLLAKMASDFQKPDKVHTLFEEEIENKMWGLPISELFMVGKKSALKLEKLGIKTIKDLANIPKENIAKKFGKYGSLIWEYANGIDFSEVQAVREVPKGIGNSATLPYDISNIEEMEKVLLVLVEPVSYTHLTLPTKRIV